MNGREKAIDAVMTYWLAGVAKSDEMAEWWMSDAAECAAELVDLVIAALKDES